MTANLLHRVLSLLISTKYEASRYSFVLQVRFDVVMNLVAVIDNIEADNHCQRVSMSNNSAVNVSNLILREIEAMSLYSLLLS